MKKLRVTECTFWRSIGFALCVFFCVPLSFSQSTQTSIPYGLSSKKWKKAQRKWEYIRFNAKVGTLDNTIYEGQIFQITEDQIQIWPSKEMVLPTQPMGDIVYLNKADIQFIEIRRKKNVLRGIIYGSLIGAAAMGTVNAIGAGDPEWGPVFFMVGALFGSVPGAVVGRLITHGSRTKKNYTLGGDIASFEQYQKELRAFSLFPNGTDLDLGRSLENPIGEVPELQQILSESPIMAIVLK